MHAKVNGAVQRLFIEAEDPPSKKVGDSLKRTRRPGKNAKSDISQVEERLQAISEQLADLDSLLRCLHDTVTVRNVQKEFYTVEEFAKLVGKARFTVREWCRHGRIEAQKAQCGRGIDAEWRISHAELLRYQNEGLLRKGR